MTWSKVALMYESNRYASTDTERGYLVVGVMPVLLYVESEALITVDHDQKSFRFEKAHGSVNLELGPRNCE